MIKKIIKKIYAKYKKKKCGLKEDWLAFQFLNDYKKDKFMHIHKIHKYGFLSTDWKLMNVNEKNYKEFISTVQYYAMHPINNQYSKWIDDKLTLKYLCSGTILDKYMPRYYASIDNSGRIYKLMDYDLKDDDINILNANDISDLLIKKGSLAIKLIQGSIGEGFYKAEYKNEKFFLNNNKMDRDVFINKISELKNYLITEYLYTNKEFEKYCPTTANTMRYLAGRIDGKLAFLKSFIRFGTSKTGFVENYNLGGILCYIDENGKFSEGNIIVNNKNERVEKHIDTNIELKGKIPLWNEIQNAVSEFSFYFPQLDYLGFDFVVTDKNEVKILEINSLTSLDTIQLDGSILKTTNGAAFFRKYIK